MINEPPKVTAIILNYLRWSETAECVRSLQASTYRPKEVLVIDNASPNDSEQALRREFPGLRILQTGKNLGYTGGINFGIEAVRASDPSYILILNPDTVVELSFLDHLVEAMEKCRSAAAACGTIHYLPPRPEAWYAGGRMIAWRGLAVHDTAPPAEAGPDFVKTGFVTGCMLLLRTEFLDTTGTLDDRFFMYLDDIEYSARIRKKGFDLLYVPKSVIYHNVVREDTSIHKLYYSVRNRFLLINTAFSGESRAVARVYFLAVLLLKLSIWRLLNPRFYRVARMGLKDYLGGAFGAGRGLSLIAGE